MLGERKVDAAIVACDIALARFASEPDREAALRAADELLGVAHALLESRPGSRRRQRAVLAGLRAQGRWRRFTRPADGAIPPCGSRARPSVSLLERRLRELLPVSLARYLADVGDERRCDEQALKVLERVTARCERDLSPEANAIVRHARSLQGEVQAALTGERQR